MSNVDPLDAPLLVEAELPSTMDAARERAQAGATGAGISGTLILARRQTGGRGRYGNRWASPEGGLYLSMILRAADAPTAQGFGIARAWLPLMAALAMYRVVAPLLPGMQSSGTASPLGIKWPNDLYLRSRKLAGVLVETGQDRLGQPFAIVGAGLNIAPASTDLPPTATSLAAEGLAIPPSLESLATAWRAQFFALPPPVDRLRSAILACLLGLGAPVTIGWREEEQTSAARQLTTSGRLIGLGESAEAILEDTQEKRIMVSEGHLLNWSTWSST